MAEGPSIPQFYARRAVLVTGATGFMGKVLLERLLSACPEVGALFLLMRTKRDAPPDQRLAELKLSPVFDALRQSDPAQLQKLRVVPGDVTRPGLGLSPESVAQLQEVSVVFNCAATVKMNEPMRRAVEQNVLSVTRLLELADELPNLAAFVHVSTGYSNCERARIEERVYPAPRALPRMLADALALPDHTPQEHVNRLISPKPNTYTFSKMMAETAVEQHRGRSYGRAIFRPTIVISPLRHPFPGWVENYNGPSGVVLAIGQGLQLVFPAKGGERPDLLPVDLAIDTLIAVGWETAIDRLPSVRVYNCSTGARASTWEHLRRRAVASCRARPLPDALWYPTCVYMPNKLIFELLTFLLQTLPAYLVEYMMRIFYPKKNRLNLIQMADKVYSGSQALRYFVTRTFCFETRNVRALRARLCADDARRFNLNLDDIDWDELFTTFTHGCLVHLAKLKDDSLPAARKRLKRLYIVHRCLTILVPVYLIRHILRSTIHYSTTVRAAQLVSLTREAMARTSVSLYHRAAMLFDWMTSALCGKGVAQTL